MAPPSARHSPRGANLRPMENHSNTGGEIRYFVIVIAMAAIVGLLIFVQLVRARPVDLVASLIISVCFVIAVITTAMWSARSEK